MKINILLEYGDLNVFQMADATAPLASLLQVFLTTPAWDTSKIHADLLSGGNTVWKMVLIHKIL